MTTYLIKNKKLIIFSLFISFIFLFPYFSKSFIPLGHDSLFHFSRIEGLARSIQDGTWIPSLYPYKNNNFGYASPLFYNDLLLTLPALFYLAFNNIFYSYLLTLFICTFFTSLSMMFLIQKFTNHPWVPYISSILYLFCNYRITNIYNRGALGEVFATAFLPLVILGIYTVIFEKDKSWKWLVIGFSGLLLSHNLSFLLACLTFLIFILINLKRILFEKRWISILKAVFLTFLLTAFFTLPMLEQILSQSFYLHYYGSSTQLENYALPLSSFFINRATFGYNNIMGVNVGVFLAFLPLLYFLLKRRKKMNKFVFQCIILGYIFMILPWDIFPWKHLFFLRILQFPWRLTLIASILLCIPASLYFTYVSQKSKSVLYLLLMFLILDAVYRIAPVLSWDRGITPTTQYTEFIDGTFSDPMGTFYLYAELAGADYLPIAPLDYREASSCIQKITATSDLEESECTLNKEATSLFFELDSEGTYILPLTYYKGYQTWLLDDEGNKIQRIPTSKSYLSLVQITTTEKGHFVCEYSGTLIQHLSRAISFITLLLLILYTLLHKKKSSLCTEPGFPN